jgi:hypothetical protein
VTFWGFTDAHSWLAGPDGSEGPLLFDARLAPKPAYFGVLDALSLGGAARGLSPASSAGAASAGPGGRPRSPTARRA